MVKITSILVFLGLLFLIAGVSPVNAAAKSTTKVCAASALGLQFSYPASWGKCTVSGSNISFRTDYKKKVVYLVAEISKNRKTDLTAYAKDKESIGFDFEPIAGGEIFDTLCRGTLGCNAAVIGKNIYSVYWDVKVGSKSSKYNSYGLTPDDIRNLIKSVKETALAKTNMVKAAANGK